MSDMSFIILAKPNTGDYYEGNFAFLRPIYPRPNVSPVRFDNLRNYGKVVFREDSYDPTTRIRRGRFYKESQRKVEIPSDTMQHKPYPRPVEFTRLDGVRVFEFQSTYEQNNDLNSDLIKSRNYDVLIGQSPAETRWTVVDAECLDDGTTLFTLKSLSSFGLLPTLKTKDSEIISCTEKVIDAMLKFTPVSIVDVCRESTRIILANKYENRISRGKDLGEIIRNLDGKHDNGKLMMVLSAAKIINRFHPRGKTAEQEKQATKEILLRSITDEDAILTVQLFGFLLRELDYAK